MLKILENNVTSKPSGIFKIFSSSGVFSSIFKTTVTKLLNKKNSKLDFSNYSPISFLSNTEKNKKGYCIIESINSSIITILSKNISIAVYYPCLVLLQ